VASQTISVAASGDDGYIIKEASTFGGSDGSFTADLTSAGFTVANRKTGFGGTEEFQRSNFIVRFDTSILPDDAVISAASLEIKSHAFFADDDGHRRFQRYPGGDSEGGNRPGNASCEHAVHLAVAGFSREHHRQRIHRLAVSR
jgi:hypothetical protein